MSDDQSNLIQELQRELSIKNEEVKRLEKGLARITFSCGEETETETESSFEKVKAFLQRRKFGSTTKINRTELYLGVISSLSCFYHLQYDAEFLENQEVFSLLPNEVELLTNKARFLATKLAFSYSLEFFRLLELKKMKWYQNDREKKSGRNESFPIQWLLGMFPCSYKPNVDDTVWLPLHIFLAIDLTISFIPLDRYLEDLMILLDEFGDAAYNEEISPLSIAVAKSFPSLEVINILVKYAPESVSQEDSEGCVPIMHAVSCNEILEIINFLYTIEPNSFQHIDNYGGSAIHYATYSGCLLVVEYILSKVPLAVQSIEGNGNLPLHNAIQNNNNIHQTEEGYNETSLPIIELMLTLFPQSIFHRDQSGALPLHKAVKYGSLTMVKLFYQAFPQAIYAEDYEHLLPIHYYAQREEKSGHSEAIVQLLVQWNPLATVYSEEQLFSKQTSSSLSSSSSSLTSSVFGSFFRSSGKFHNKNSTVDNNNKKQMRRKSSVTTTRRISSYSPNKK